RTRGREPCNCIRRASRCLQLCKPRALPALRSGHTLPPLRRDTRRRLQRMTGMFEISRRNLIIGAAGAYAAFGLDRPIAFIGAAQAQTIPAAPAFKSYKVGDLEVVSLFDGVWEKAHDEAFI